MAALEFLAGALVLAAVMYDIFLSIEVPRVPSRSFRLTSFLFRVLWPSGAGRASAFGQAGGVMSSYGASRPSLSWGRGLSGS